MIKSVTAQNPCPICGKPDWCGRFDLNGYPYICCQRDTSMTDICGTDGRQYVYVFTSKRGASIFEEAEQNKARRKAWKENHAFQNNNAAPVQKVLTPVDIVEPLPNAALNKLYRRMLDLLILEPRHKQYLLDEGWTEDMIQEYHIKSMPEQDFLRFKNKGNPEYESRNIWRSQLAKKLIDEFGSIKGLPGAFEKNDKWTFYGQPGIIFPMYDGEQNLFRLRIRIEGAESNKYRNLSSWKEDEDAEKEGFLVNKFHFGCRAGNQIGFYFHQSDDMYIWYITEGEKKSIMGNTVLKNPFIDVPGVNSYHKLIEGKNGERPVDIIKKKGGKILIIAYDADKAVNEKVMKSQMQTIKLMQEEGFVIGLAEWNQSLGKGIDDLLVNGYRPAYTLA